jgi:PAS domain S-box-containing protein
VVYDPQNTSELVTGNFYDVCQAADGTMWFAGNNGLYHLARGKFTRYTREHGLPANFVRSVLALEKGSTIVGTSQGIALLRDGQAVTPAGWKKIGGTVRDLVTLPDGRVLVCASSGLWQLVGDEAEKLSEQGGLPAATYWCALQLPDGSRWLGTNRGLFHTKPDGTVTAYGLAEGLPNLGVQCILVDSAGTLWVGTTAGLCRLREGKIELARYTEGFGGTTISRLAETRERALLVASNAGLFQLSDTPIRGIDVSSGLDQALVNVRDRSYFLALWNGDVYRFENGRVTRPASMTRLPSDYFCALYEEPDGTIWAGGDNALLRLVGDHQENFYLGAEARAWRDKLKANPALELPGVAHDRVYCIVPDGENGLWIGAQGGLYRMRERKFTIEPGTLGKSIKSVIVARNGDVWASTPQGAMRRRDGVWTTFPVYVREIERLGRNLSEDSTGTIWLTLDSSGLVRFVGERWRHYTAREGLYDEKVTGVMEDDHGYLWIGSTRGLMRVARTDFDALDAGKISTLTCQLFTRRDGMPDSECSEAEFPFAWKMPDGKMLFPTFRGVAVIDPRDISFNELKPPVYIEETMVGGVLQDMSAPITLSPTHSDVQFRYTATSLLSPTRVSFKVKLTPLDKDWIDMGNRRDFRYSQLPPGDYEFRVIASNNNNVWNDEGAALTFTVRPFFYRTPWFYTLAGVFVVAVVLGIYRWRVRVFRKRAAELQNINLELERRIGERTAELAKSNEALRSSEYFYHSLVESLPQIIVRKDTEGRFTYANHAFGELVGMPAERIVGKTDADLYPPDLAARYRADDLRLMQDGQILEYERVVEKSGSPKRYLHAKKVPLFSAEKKPIGVLVLFWDMTVFRETEQQLRQAQKELIETSRLAGIAEMATGVLHNIGNALNSVNTSASLASERLHAMKLPSIDRVVQLMVDQGDRLVDFFATDPRGQQLPSYLAQLAKHLHSERSEVAQELKTLQTAIDHIKEIVASQQDVARVSGIDEIVTPAELFEYALRISEVSLTKHQITVVREFVPTPALKLQRPKAVQILVNLIRNAKDALNASTQTDKRLTIGIRPVGEDRVQLYTIDNGVGIATEHLTSIFAFGFTTKASGHGFGMHSSALTAKELGGTLIAKSDGPGQGASFILELPVMKETTTAA